MIDFSRNHFELFGLPARYRVDTAALDAAYRKLQTEVHPDRFASGTDVERRLALQSSARVNEAYRALKTPVDRAQYLLALRGIDAADEKDTSLDMDFLERQLERREEAQDAHAAGDVRTLSALRDAALAEARALEEALVPVLDADAPGVSPQADYAAARPRVRELAFLVKLADDLDAMVARLD